MREHCIKRLGALGIVLLLILTMLPTIALASDNAQSTRWLDAAAAKTLTQTATQSGQSYVRVDSGKYDGIKKEALAALAGFRFEFDSMSGNAVQTRLVFSTPANIKTDLLLTGEVKGTRADKTYKLFHKFFSNELRVVSFAQTTAWGTPVRVATHVDLKGMDTKNLYFYAYNRTENKYSRVQKPDYSVDKNGYLWFTTESAGDVIISVGALMKRAVPLADTPVPTPTSSRDSSGGGSSNGGTYYPPAPSTIYAISMTDDGLGTATATPNNAAAGTSISIAATPADTYHQFKQWVVVSGGAALSSITDNPATFTMPAANVSIKAEFEPTAAALAAANAEAAKITDFTAGTNDTNNLNFNLTGFSNLTAGTTLNLVDTKTGAASPGAVTDLGASLSSGVLSLNTQKVVDAADLTYVGLTFTATLNGVTSDPVTLDISSLFGVTTTAGKLRTDKAKIPTNGSAIGTFIYITGTTTLNTYYSLTPNVTLSSGEAFAPVTGFIIGGGSPGINANQLSLKADVGGDIQIAFAAAPTVNFNCRWQHVNIVLTCDGTSYTRSGVDFLVMFIVA